MSTNPSIIFYQGLRCTKVPRKPRATDPPLKSQPESPPTVTSETSDPISSVETSAPGPTSTTDDTSITAAPVTTTSILDSRIDPSLSQTSSPQSESQSSLDIGIHRTDSSVTYTTFTTETSTIQTSTTETSTTETSTTETSTTAQTSTSLSQPIPSVSDDDSSGPPYAAIFGTIFGILGFITLIAIIFFFFFPRRRRRNLVVVEGAFQKPLIRNGRESADSTTSLRRDYRSQMSYLSDASQTSSAIFKSGEKHHQNQHQNQNRTPPGYSDPFSDTAEVVAPGPEPEPSTPTSAIPFVLRTSPETETNPKNPTPTPPDPTAQSRTNRDSIQSGTSLGSTLVLPGRSSMGSDYHHDQNTSLYFPKPSDASSPSAPRVVMVFRKDITKSDPFDLCTPHSHSRISASRRSSGAIPGALF
ncbi:hypothetical protein BDW59DRAFT_48282 [Aspergillus cavernicola]|uniref:REJ domain-containing protein n=1 Tax=Aspergillus cavernicola TaxID=176166 RepID=A0ABR4J387_9EURO